MTNRIPESLRAYIEARILPRYDGFDAAHRRDHAETVIRQSPETTAVCCRDHVETENRQSLETTAARVRRMTLQRTPAAPAKVLITAEFPILK